MTKKYQLENTARKLAEDKLLSLLLPKDVGEEPVRKLRELFSEGILDHLHVIYKGEKMRIKEVFSALVKCYIKALQVKSRR